MKKIIAILIIAFMAIAAYASSRGINDDGYHDAKTRQIISKINISTVTNNQYAAKVLAAIDAIAYMPGIVDNICAYTNDCTQNKMTAEQIINLVNIDVLVPPPKQTFMQRLFGRGIPEKQADVNEKYFRQLVPYNYYGKLTKLDRNSYGTNAYKLIPTVTDYNFFRRAITEEALRIKTIGDTRKTSFRRRR